MNIQVNRAHSPIKEFFQSPQVQRSLKITAVALAALAVIGAVVATAVILGMPLLTLIAAPVAIGAIVLSIILAKRSKPLPAPQVQDPEPIYPEPVELPATQEPNQEEEERRIREENAEMIAALDKATAAVIAFKAHHEKLDADRKLKSEKELSVGS